MPTTVNGIGTHYYGKRDVASRTGACQHCGAQAKLESYTTRLWFVIVFIPVIPLKRVRLLDYCPRCSRHWVADPEQYEKSRQLTVSSALEKYRDDPSVEAALLVHAQLLGFHMHSEADRFRDPALEQFPDSAELRYGFASHLDQTGRWMDATALHEKAFELNPSLPNVRACLAWRRTNENKLDEAYKLLDFMRQPGAGQSFNLGQLETLARSYQKAGNHERVLEICAHLLRELPAVGENHEFRKLVTKSERALNHSPSLLPERKFSIQGLLDSKSGQHAPWVRWAVFGSVAAVLLGIGMAILNEHHRTHRTVHVVNAFAQPVSVSVDGGPPISVAVRTPITLAEGKHRFTFSGPVKKEDEILVQTGYWSRWSYSPIWVYNLERLSQVSAATVKYSANPQPAEYKSLTQTELNYVPHVDYIFEKPPETMKVKGNHETITKIHVSITTLPPTTVYLGLNDNPDQNVPRTFAEGHLNRNPNDASLLNVYCHTEGEADEQRVTNFLKTGLWRKPISVVWHRAYQHQKSVSANFAPLAADYDAQLQQDPNDAALLYLRGRIASTRAEQLQYFRSASEKNPQSGWPALGIAYDAANRGNWPEAKVWCDKAVNSLRSDPSFRSLWHIVRIANKDWSGLEADYRQQLQGQDYTEVISAAFFLADVLASQQKFDEAKQAIRQFLARVGGANASPESLSSFDLMIDYVCGNVDAFRQAQDKAFAKHQSRYQFHFLLAIGEPDSALKVEGMDKFDDDWTVPLAVSLAYALARNPTEADKWNSRACDELQKGDDDWKRAAALLQRKTPPTSAELDEIVLRITETPLFLATLAQRFPDRKGKLLSRVQLLNISRQPAYLLVKRVLERS